MDDIYRLLSTKIADLKKDGAGNTDYYSDSSLDGFFGEQKADLSVNTPVNEGAVAAVHDIIALQRAMMWMYQDAIWQVTGASSYSDQLLFQDVAGNITWGIDTLANTCISIYGPNSIDAGTLAFGTQTWVEYFQSIQPVFYKAVVAELALQKLCENLMGTSKAFDASIQSLMSYRTQYIALLKKRLGPDVKIASQDLKRVACMGVLSDFFKVGSNLLIKKCEKDLWHLTKDAKGNTVIEKLYNGDILDY